MKPSISFGKFQADTLLNEHQHLWQVTAFKDLRFIPRYYQGFLEKHKMNYLARQAYIQYVKILDVILTSCLHVLSEHDLKHVTVGAC